MKKLILQLIFLSPVFAFAQPVINAVTLPIGASFSVYSCDKLQPGFPVSGFNNWDFSTLSYDPNPSSIHIVLPANTPYSADFPTANMCQQFESNGQVNGYVYLQQNDDSLVALGGRDYLGYNWDWINPALLYPFPFVLNQSIVDEYESNDGLHDSMMFRYVAWGNLKTPKGNTYSNVFLYQSNIYDFNSNSWVPIGYQWISVATLQSVFDFFLPNPSSEFFENETNTSGIKELQLEEKLQLSLYPNPASTQSRIEFNLPQRSNVSIQLISLDGKRNSTFLSESLPSGKHRIPILTSELSEGIYFVRIVIDNQVVVKTLEVVD